MISLLYLELLTGYIYQILMLNGSIMTKFN